MAFESEQLRKLDVSYDEYLLFSSLLFCYNKAGIPTDMYEERLLSDLNTLRPGFYEAPTSRIGTIANLIRSQNVVREFLAAERCVRKRPVVAPAIVKCLSKKCGHCYLDLERQGFCTIYNAMEEGVEGAYYRKVCDTCGIVYDLDGYEAISTVGLKEGK